MKSRWRKGFRLVLLLLVLVGFWFWENETIVTEEWVVTSPKIPQAFSGFRIVELADLHSKQLGDENRQLIQAIKDAQPDMIAIDGDLLDCHTQDWQWVIQLAQELVQVAPTFFVTGNHEWQLEELPEILEGLEEAGVTVLRNQSLLLQLDGENIILAGVDDPNGPYDQKTPQTVVEEAKTQWGEENFLVVLAHRNDQIDMWEQTGADLVLTGHGHGGIIRLPFLGGLFDRDGSFLQPYSAGLYQAGNTIMAVSRGLGNSRGGFRLFNRPHLPVLTLQPGGES